MEKGRSPKTFMKYCRKFGSVNVGVSCIDFVFLNAGVLGMKKEGIVSNVCKGQMMTIATKENCVFKILCTS